MSDSRNTDNSAIAAQLTQTQALIQSLLKEMRDGSVAQAALKAELKQLRYSVSMLSNIIRGGEGGGQSLMTEVALLKAKADDLDEQVEGLSAMLSGQMSSIQSKMAEGDAQRRVDETQRMTLQHKSISDERLDKRQRLNTYATIFIAVISLAGSILALLLRGGGE